MGIEPSRVDHLDSLQRLYSNGLDEDVPTMQLTIRSNSTVYYITSVPAMPEIELTATVIGAVAPPGSAFTWTFVLDYPGFISVPSSFPRNGSARRHPAMLPMAGNPVRVPFAIVTGGRLTVTVTANVGGQALTAMRDDILIGGTNPTAADLMPVAPDKLMRQMMRQESGGAQFNDGRGGRPNNSVNPNWSQDNLRGVGLGQLTVPPPTADEAWNWRINAASLQRRYREKRQPAATLHTRIMASPRFQSEVRVLNAWRLAEGQPPIAVTLPVLTSDQQDQEGLRAYNGFGRKVAGQYLDYIHEFEPTMTTITSAARRNPAGQLLASPSVLAVDAGGVGSWTQVSAAERNLRSGGRAPGDPDYVAHVLAQPG